MPFRYNEHMIIKGIDIIKSANPWLTTGYVEVLLVDQQDVNDFLNLEVGGECTLNNKKSKNAPIESEIEKLKKSIEDKEKHIAELKAEIERLNDRWIAIRAHDFESPIGSLEI